MTASSFTNPYLYDVQPVERNRIPDRIVYRVTPANSTRITTRDADDGGFPLAKEQRFGWRPWQTCAWNDTSRFVATPREREEWVTTGPVWQHRVSHGWPCNDLGALLTGVTERSTSCRARRAEKTWPAPVVRPASPRGIPEPASIRTGDTLALRVPEFVDRSGNPVTQTVIRAYGLRATGTGRDGGAAVPPRRRSSPPRPAVTAGRG